MEVYLVEAFHGSNMEIDKVDMSDVFEKLNDIETGLYMEDSAYIYEMLKREKSKWFNFPRKYKILGNFLSQ